MIDDRDQIVFFMISDYFNLCDQDRDRDRKISEDQYLINYFTIGQYSGK